MNDWFKDWFASKDYLNVYAHRNSEDAKALIELFTSHILVPENSLVLDAACGNGRHAEILSQKGYKVVGFDLSKTLLHIAQKNKINNNLNVNYFCADLRSIPLTTKFTLITSLFTSFGYFKTDAENFSLVKFAGSHLIDRGYFVLDYLNPKYVESNLIPNSERQIGNKVILENRRITGNRVEKEIVISEGKFRNRYFESVQLYSFQEILTMFKLFGFYSVKMFGSYSGGRYNEEKSERMIIIFQKG